MSNLIECPDCGRKVSKNARACPGCGHAVPNTSNLAFVLRFVTGIITATAFVAGLGEGHDIASALIGGVVYAALPAILFGMTYVRGVA